MDCVQLKEVLRLNHMINKFDSTLNAEDAWYKLSQEGYMEQHPYWIKMTKQANKILELLRKKK